MILKGECMYLNEQQKNDFSNNGFLVINNFISQELCINIKNTIELLAQFEKSNGYAHFYGENLQRIWNLISKNELFREIIIDDRIAELMNWIFDRATVHRKFLLSSFQANIVGSGGGQQVLHIDTPVPDPIPIWPLKANTIWCIDDFTEKNGATIVVPASHKFLRRPNKGIDQEISNQISIIAPKGALIITHGGLWHRSGENNTESSRIALLGSFAASYTREISSEEDYSKTIPNELLPNIDKKLKDLIGLDFGVKPGSIYN